MASVVEKGEAEEAHEEAEGDQDVPVSQVAKSAQQAKHILFKDEVYTNMKLKASDQAVQLQRKKAAELRAVQSQAAMEEKLQKLDNRITVLVDVSELLGGGYDEDNALCVPLALGRDSTLWDVKVKLQATMFPDDNAKDFDVYGEDCGTDPLLNHHLVMAISGKQKRLKLPKPYALFLWAERQRPRAY